MDMVIMVIITTEIFLILNTRINHLLIIIIKEYQLILLRLNLLKLIMII